MCCFFFEQKTAYETRISDWSSDVCSSDLAVPEALRGRLLQLSWYDRYKAVEPSRRFELRAGSRWRFELRLRAPRGLRNPGVFDSEKTALARRIAATGYVRKPESARPLSGAGGGAAWRGARSTSAERRVGTECVSTCDSWWSPYHSKIKQNKRK